MVKTNVLTVETRRLFNDGNRFSVKVMVSAAVTWKGVTGPFLLGEKKEEKGN